MEFQNRGPELLTNEQMSYADKLAIDDGKTGFDLMRAAGNGIFKVLRKSWTWRKVLVLCGPGNNGGDGFIVAALLRNAGWPVKIGMHGEISSLTGDAALAAKFWNDKVQKISTDLLSGVDLIVDGLFGAGLARNIDGYLMDIIDKVNESDIDCLSIDMPSGIDGNTGQVKGIALRANETVTFFRKKPGHLLIPGKLHSDKIHIVDIGMNESVLHEIKPNLAENIPQNWLEYMPRPKLDDHKYSRGQTVIVGGEDMPGAARLAALAARRVGSGLATIVANKKAEKKYFGGDPGCLFKPLLRPESFKEIISNPRVNAVLVGPGSGVNDETLLRVKISLKMMKATVIDADALTVFQDNPKYLFDLIKGPTVMTPHSGEFTRLFDNSLDKLSSCRTAAKLSGAIVIFKGSDTVISAPDGRSVINCNAPPALATAGSGDVLAGFIAGLLTQGMPVFEAVSAGVWLHGEAANILGEGLIAEDIASTIPQVLNTLWTL